MNREELRLAVQSRFNENSSAVNTVYEKFTAALDERVKDYISAKGLDLSAQGEATIFRDGQKHYYRMRDMARYGADDLNDILKTELDLILGGLRANNVAGASILMHIFGINAGRHVHSYPSRLSTLIDNLYFLIASFYEISVDGTFNIKKIINQRLTSYNRDLRDHLTSHVVKKSFYRLRNAQVHDAPDFMEWISSGEEELPCLSLEFFDGNSHMTAERAFDYLFPFYERTLETSTKAVELLLV